MQQDDAGIDSDTICSVTKKSRMHKRTLKQEVSPHSKQPIPFFRQLAKPSEQKGELNINQ
jgi:hypothetical protein